MNPASKTVAMIPLILFTALVWAAEADPRDKAIQENLDFFESIEVLETMPLLTEFGQVIDEIEQDGESPPQPKVPQ